MEEIVKEKISAEEIKIFLEGFNEQKYIVAAEHNFDENSISLVINDPEKGKYIEKHKFKPFAWSNIDGCISLFKGDRTKLKTALSKYGIEITLLRTDGVKRLETGYKFLIQCKNETDFNSFLKFFKEAGIYNVFSDKNFIILNAVSQYLIQTGKRLFKGIDNYEDVHKMVFDIETTGLDPRKESIINIGVRDNRGFEHILDVNEETELSAISTFFKLVETIKPDIVTGYNSENFDFPFFEGRAEKAGYNIDDLTRSLLPNKPMKRVKSIIKLGGETEFYKQTKLWGINVIDTYHAVRRFQAINSNLTKAGLKYVTKFSKINKENRVYVEGNIISKTYLDTENKYAFNDIDGDWYMISEEKPLKEGYEIVSGKFIVHRYLLDDLWETQEVDTIYNQANFLISKLIPTTFTKTATSGTASLWKLILQDFSYQKGLAIPSLLSKRKFVGGLSRLLRVGYVPNVVKFDFTSLYPTIAIRYNVSPDVDILNAMLSMLEYILDERITYKDLNKKYGKLAEKLEKNINGELNEKELNEILKQIKDYKKLASDCDKKQLPLKILANSFFGSYGCQHIFNWGSVTEAETITCIGRQFFRIMVEFMSKKGFQPIVGDSVTYDTPIYIKYDVDNRIDIVAISDIFDNSDFTDINGQQRDFNIKPFTILTRGGWKKIKYVYRHKTDKKLYTVTTKDRMGRLTEDHSLFSNGVEITPSELKIGSHIDVIELPKNTVNYEMTEDKAYLMGCFMGDGSATYDDSRTQKYFSKRKGCYVEYSAKRIAWKISSDEYDLLEKLQKIVKTEYNIDVPIKDYRSSSKCYELKCEKKLLAQWFSENFYTNYREKKVPYCILNASKEIKKAFLNGFWKTDGDGIDVKANGKLGQKTQVGMAGFSMLLKELGYDYTLGLISRRNNFTNFTINSFDGYQGSREIDEVVELKEFDNGDNFVYDVSTEDGTFIGGIGGIIFHNTDGLNFRLPDNHNEIEYISDGKFFKNEKDKKYIGIEAAVAEFNDLYMVKPTGLSVDELCASTINFSKKNYCDLMPPDRDGHSEIKLVGNTIKSKAMSGFIAEFLEKSIKLLLYNNGYEFAKYYMEYVDKIVNNKIPLNKIASVSKVKKTVSEYQNYCKQTTKAGRLNSRQAYMELIIKHDLSLDLGDKVYYYNVGTKKSHPDIKLNKEKTAVNFKCQLVPAEIMEQDKDIFIEDLGDEYGLYNVAKYLEMFRKRVKPLFVCFNEGIREKLMNFKSDDVLSITEEECVLVSGVPFKEGDQTTLDELMTPSDQEIEFWIIKKETPTFMSEERWSDLQKDYYKRKEEEKFNYEILEEIKDQNDIEINSEVLFQFNNDSSFKTEIKDIDDGSETGDDEGESE